MQTRPTVGQGKPFDEGRLGGCAHEGGIHIVTKATRNSHRDHLSGDCGYGWMCAGTCTRGQPVGPGGSAQLNQRERAGGDGLEVLGRGELAVGAAVHQDAGGTRAEPHAARVGGDARWQGPADRAAGAYLTASWGKVTHASRHPPTRAEYENKAPPQDSSRRRCYSTQCTDIPQQTGAHHPG
jgi:hypothetical protein